MAIHLQRAPANDHTMHGTAADDELRHLQRRFAWLHIACPSLSLSLTMLGLALGSTALARIGLLALAATLLTLGVLAIHEQRFIVWQEHVSNRVALTAYRGLGASAFGAAACIAGIVLLVGVVAHALGSGVPALRQIVWTRPSLALLPIGAWLLCTGLGFVCGMGGAHDADKGAWFNALLSLPMRLGGVLLMVLGAAAAAAGVFEWLQPDAFDRALAAAFGAGLRPHR